MPQFDFFSFFVQVFWLTVAIFSFYSIYKKDILAKNFHATELIKKIKDYIKVGDTEGKIKPSALYEKVLHYLIKQLKGKKK